MAFFKSLKETVSKRPRHVTTYWERYDVVPDWLKSEKWINERGFQVGGPAEAILKAKNCREIPLYSIHKAVQQKPGADLYFKGQYYRDVAHIPYYLQPLSYFETHGLFPQGAPVAKLLVNNQLFVDYYLIPSILNLSQRQSLQADWVLQFNGEIYSCAPEELPSSLKRKKQLEEAGLPIPKKAVAYWFTGNGFVPLYRLSQVVTPKPPLKVVSKVFESPSCSFELTPLKKGEWWSNPENYVLLDTQTTGISNHDEIIQLVVIGFNKETLYQQYFKPSVNSSKQAYEVHHIEDHFLQDKPLWKNCWAEIESLLKDKIILIQNATFKSKMIQQTCEKYQIQSDTKFQVKDTMPYFEQMVGVKSLKKVMMELEIEHDDSKLHDAIEDCVKIIESLNKTIN